MSETTKAMLSTITVIVFLSVNSLSYGDTESISSLAQLDAKEVLSMMLLHNRLREADLNNYLVHRTYKVSNNRFNKFSEMEVSMKFLSPGRKEFSVISSTGSKFLRRKVLERLIEAEKEATEEATKRKSDITEENYKFDLVGKEEINSHLCYILETKPKRADKYLLDGKIWVDCSDYAIARIEGTPIKKPSIWTRKIHFVRNYEKIQNFWLPRVDETVTDVLIFGRSTLTIKYDEYKINLKSGEESQSSKVSTRDVQS